MNKLGKRINILLILILCSFLFASCQKEEVYNPVKKTGDEAPPVELPITESEQEDEEVIDEPEEVQEEVVKEVRNPQDFSTLRVFQVAQEEIVVRQEPSIESEILKYLVEGEELIVVDKVKDEYGEEWYVVRLFDYDMTYGFTVTSNLRYVREIEVKIEGNTEGGFESDE